eukprot:CAMPEP_0178396790 /NCGR_PEP_ID=MMETSP0689_2-20121128/13908_1 /TAXON_ID=160604 /ORGANISM="Amphidinium massartii, Strain CS-259" /LENGTH=147 /DNA_ID=CAMNT_0020017471 /DNA_START=282 /DNA_END=725 /DNA_ORIENTATION=-
MSSVRSASKVTVAYSVQSRLPRHPSPKEAMTRKPTNRSKKPVTVKVGANITLADSQGHTDSLRNSSTDTRTMGAQSSAKETAQATEKARRRTMLPKNERHASQKAENGSTKRGKGFGSKASPSSAAATNGTMLIENTSITAHSAGEV